MDRATRDRLFGKKAEAPAPASAKQPDPAPAKPKKEPAATVKHSCGHKTALRHYENMCCESCRTQARRAKNLKRQEARLKAQPSDKSQEERLPDGAVFEVKYEADTQTWSGSLAVPSRVADGCNIYQTFSGQASGVFRLLRNLDALYREWEAGRAKE